MKPTHRHIKRGTLYEAIGVAKVQISSAHPKARSTETRILLEWDEVVVYRGEDGQLWVRPVDEFHRQGRFEEVK